MDKKQEELGKLYALRAGLSVISQDSDDYDKNEEACALKQDILDKNHSFKSIEQVERKYNETIASIDSRKSGAEYALRRAEGERDIAKKEYKNTLIKYIILLSVIIITLPAIIGGVILYIASVTDSVLYAKSERKKEYLVAKARYEDCLVKLDRINKSYASEIAQAKEDRNLNYDKLKAYESQANITGKFIIATKFKQVEIKKECMDIEQALIKEYRALLDTRDWENLDLIIYYYETQRADSVKEALQLVDVERRNNELVNSIQRASAEICNTMQSSMQVLGKVLVAGFNSLSAQLEAQRLQTMDALNQINNNISGVLSQQKLNAALLAKANVSSKEMVEQMKALNHKVKSA